MQAGLRHAIIHGMPSTPEQRKKHAEYMRTWSKTHPEKRTLEGKKRRYAWMSERRRQRKADNPEYKKRLHDQAKAFRTPEMHRAHEAVRKAIKSGKLTRPSCCDQCHSEGTIEAAHTDYQKQLQVRWLCISCHRSEDAHNPKSKECRP